MIQHALFHHIFEFLFFLLEVQKKWCLSAESEPSSCRHLTNDNARVRFQSFYWSNYRERYSWERGKIMTTRYESFLKIFFPMLLIRCQSLSYLMRFFLSCSPSRYGKPFGFIIKKSREILSKQIHKNVWLPRCPNDASNTRTRSFSQFL